MREERRENIVETCEGEKRENEMFYNLGEIILYPLEVSTDLHFCLQRFALLSPKFQM
jgi:hypothetical protein